MQISALLPLLIIGTALSAALINVVLPQRWHRYRHGLNITAAGACVIIITLLGVGVYQGQIYMVRLPFMPGAQLQFEVDATAMLFVALTGVLWLLTTVYAIGYLANDRRPGRFFTFFSLSAAATLGVALSANLLTFVLFYELLTLATFPLVAHKGNAASLRAATLYLRYTLTGGVLLLAGLLWLRSMAGPLEFTVTGILGSIGGLDPTSLQLCFALILAGLGVKAAIVPLHGWLPEAMAAPAPVSALLHAVAVVKAGAFGIIRVVYDIYGIELATELHLTTVLALFAAVTIVYGSLRAVWQQDIKKRLAYSTVSQVSYIALGTAIAGPIATIGGMIHLVHQGLMKITLFFCAGSLAEKLNITQVHQLDGVGSKMPASMAAFTVAALGMIGVPPVAGFVSKWYLSNGAIEVGAYWVLAVLATSSLLNAIYFLPLLHRIWFKRPASREMPTYGRHYWLMVIPPVITASLALAGGLLANAAFSPLNWAKLIAASEYGQDFFYQAAPDTFVGAFILACVVLPLAWLVMANLTPRSWWLPRGTWLCALPALAMAVWGGPVDVQLGSWFFGARVALDEPMRLFLLLASGLWAGAMFYARGYFIRSRRSNRFFCWSALAMSGSFGLIVAQDMFFFLTCYTLMSLAAYALVIFNQTHAARQAAYSYIKWAVAAELLLFTGFSLLSQWQAGLADGINWVASVCLLAGFGIKMGVLGLHFWLPLAHPAAPVPASALLSGIMVKAGLVGILKFLPVMPPTISLGIMTVGAAGIFAGALLGLRAQQPKSVLAWSTISQMGLVFMVLGAVVESQSAWPALALVLAVYCVHHGVIKAGLFLLVAVLPASRTWTPLHWAGLLTGCLALPGLPLSGAAVAKNSLKTLQISEWVVAVISLSAVATTLLMLHFARCLYYASPAHKAPANKPMQLVTAGLLILAPVTGWALMPAMDRLELAMGSAVQTLLLIGFTALFYWYFLRPRLTQSAKHTETNPAKTPTQLKTSTNPVKTPTGFKTPTSFKTPTLSTTSAGFRFAAQRTRQAVHDTHIARPPDQSVSQSFWQALVSRWMVRCVNSVPPFSSLWLAGVWLVLFLGILLSEVLFS